MADAELIALAPEMAEAILNYVGTDVDDDGLYQLRWRELNETADKLRAIGASDD